MKKIFLLALTAVIMAGCSDKKYEYKYATGIVERDSCEYLLTAIAINEHLYITMPHKGNCRFCSERRRQELQSIVEQLKEK